MIFSFIETIGRNNSLDYWQLLCGLSLILLAVLCRLLARQRNEMLDWRWLAVFGLLQGIYCWLEMLTASFEDSVAFAAFRLALLILSSISLAQSGRCSINRLGAGRRGLWPMAIMLCLAATGGLAGLTGLNISVRIFLSLGGGIWAALALAKASRLQSDGKLALRMASWGIAVYAISYGSGIPSALNFAVTKAPPSLTYAELSILARTILMALTSAALWSYFRRTMRLRASETNLPQAGRFDQCVEENLRSRLPINALPAQVEKTEIKRWHAVDMDACLSTPINPNTLFNTMAGNFAVSQPTTKASEPKIESSSDSNDSNDVFNPSTLMDRIGGDAATFKKLVAMFQTQAPQYVATLATAAASGNLAQIRHEAHTLRGAAANMGADNTARLAGRIETAATQEDLESIQPLIEQLNQELVCLKQALYNIPAPAPVFKDERINACAS
jgi:HPt (histidine-containing phosphotransfer) domain-containing protein